MKTFLDFICQLDERVLTIGFNKSQEPLREQHRQAIHDILRRSYEEIGGYGGLEAGTEEESQAIHSDISHAGLIKVIHRNGIPTAVALYKKQFGRKLIAVGTNGTEQGKKDFGQIANEDHNLKRAWLEASGKLEHLYKNKIGYPVIHSHKMSALTGKTDIDPVEGSEHYTRSIGGTIKRKIGLGHPEYE